MFKCLNSPNIVKITAKYCIVDTGYWFVPGLLLKMTDKLAVTADTLRPRFLPPAAAARRIINELSFCLLVMLEAARLTKTAGSCVSWRGIVTWDTNLLLEFTSLERGPSRRDSAGPRAGHL